jgi:hypothetical protein
MTAFYPDCATRTMASALALVHQRYSTNTFPSWDLAQPFRYLCHNGEINTVQGNINWMRAREPLFRSGAFGDDMADLIPGRHPRRQRFSHPGQRPGTAAAHRPPPGPVHDDADPRGLAAPRNHEPCQKRIFTPTTPASWSPGTARRPFPSPTESVWGRCWTETACAPAATR